MPGNSATTVFCGNLDDRVTERILYDVMVQAGALVDVYMPRDRETQKHKGYGFAEFETEEGAEYALKLFSGLVSLYNRAVRFSMAGGSKSGSTVGESNTSNPSSHHMATSSDEPKAVQLPFPFMFQRSPLLSLPLGLQSAANAGSPITPPTYQQGWSYPSGGHLNGLLPNPWFPSHNLLPTGSSLLHRQ